MRATRLLGVGVSLVVGLLAGSTLAEEIVHFTNGTTMPIESHAVAGDMIYVELGVHSHMAFPLLMVEKITRAGKEIDLNRSTAARNRMLQGDADVSIASRAGSTSTAPEELSLEEKIRRYTEAARSGVYERETLTPGEMRSTSADRLDERDMDGAGISPRQQFAGAEPNLSGRRLSYIRGSQRKTVGGKIVGTKSMPSKAGVELVGMSRAFSPPNKKTSGPRGGSVPD